MKKLIGVGKVANGRMTFKTEQGVGFSRPVSGHVVKVVEKEVARKQEMIVIEPWIKHACEMQKIKINNQQRLIYAALQAENEANMEQQNHVTVSTKVKRAVTRFVNFWFEEA